ncbi:MAG: hypothetical protein OXG58_11415 [Gemmatimonadetes bacterium]|nr:hypothetical protein [Gemmatimonadota bacterium]MCY3943852.1 hypothetical protein [Gemmatimonadota bacterium]
MLEAAVYGRRVQGTNPCEEVTRYPERQRERTLTSGELRRLAWDGGIHATGGYSTVLLPSERLNQRRIAGPQLDSRLCAAENELAETEAPKLLRMAGSGHDGDEVNGRAFGNKSLDYTSSTLELAFDLRSLDCTALQLDGRNPVFLFLDLGKKQVVTTLLVIANRCTSPIQVD